MKFKLLLWLIAIVTFKVQAQWQPTGISTNPIETIYDVQAHNNVLYASSNTDGFIKSSDNGNSWQSVGQTEFSTNSTDRYVSHIRTAGSNLYVATFNANFASSVIYKSADNGQTFVADTLGLPQVSVANEIQDVQYLYHHNGYVIADIANTGNYWKHSSGTSWQRNNDANTQFSEFFAFFGNKFYAWANYHLHVSQDNGQSWTQATDTNIPILFLANNLITDPDTGRIYMAGKSIIETNYRLFYSDNDGGSWTEIDMSSYIGNNWIGVPQQIRKLFVKGDYIQVALDNDANPSAPDILVSTNNGESFTPDISGLPINTGGTTTAINFILHNNTLFMALNYVDIYKKPFSTLSLNSVDNTNTILVYPNPSKSTFHLKSTIQIKQVNVYDLKGRLIQSLKNHHSLKTVKIENNGVYFLEIIDNMGNSTIKKIIKN